ncbi:MAG: hypothetical protein NT154_07970, partial [Verrucomicrobia bacterium]|nr:hypothetical protein [Verrucomicrobiota bacterium]
MKARKVIQQKRNGWRWASLLSPWVIVSTVSAADTNAPGPAPQTKQDATTNAPAASTNAAPASVAAAPKPAAIAALTPEQYFEGGTNTYNNWIEFGMGGFLTKGNKSQAQQQNQNSSGTFGGIQDLHLQQEVSKGTTVTVDGRSIFDEHDYKLSLGVEKEKLGYLRFSASEFRSWYNGDGGFYPPNGTYFSQGGDALGLDRGDFSIEGGLTLENKPKVTFKYEHSYREGQKSSTSWGFTHPAGGSLVQGLSPSIY